MVPCRKKQQHFDAYLMNRIGGEAEEGYEYNYYNYCTRERQEEEVEADTNSNKWLLGSDLAINNGHMAHRQETTDEEGGSGSKKQEQDSWLQLSIGGKHKHHEERVNMSRGSVDLDLLPPTAAGQGTRPPSGPCFFLHPAAEGFSSSYSPSLVMGMGSYFHSDVKVIPPPRRPHSGLWFMLQPSPNQVKQPFLPQIPKSYLRIKDGRMTIRLLIKYLVNKLRLDSESEIEIRCRGQELLPFLTLQHVRDTLWTTNSTDHHLMLLHYSRTP